MKEEDPLGWIFRFCCADNALYTQKRAKTFLTIIVMK